SEANIRKSKLPDIAFCRVSGNQLSYAPNMTCLLSVYKIPGGQQLSYAPKHITSKLAGVNSIQAVHFSQHIF
ncbi:MAG TPA: hypothetical protein P5511_09410, partial [Candidatus Goldiibacteriota bacterium]|nr:hypothetical protein [Candidatus Goldiibacteriota bacterium]